MPAEGAAAAGLAAGGWVIELRGYHLHNNRFPTSEKSTSATKVRSLSKNTLLKNLETGKVKLPDGPGGKLIEVSIAELGIRYPR